MPLPCPDIRNEPAQMLAINVGLPLLITVLLYLIGPSPITRGIALATAFCLAVLNIRGVMLTTGQWRLGYAAFGIGNLLALVFFADLSLASLLLTGLRLM